MWSLPSTCASENASVASHSFSSALPNAKQFQLIRDWPCREYAAAQLPLVFAKAQSSRLCLWFTSAFGSRCGAITRKHSAGLSRCMSCREGTGIGARAPRGCSLMGRSISKHRFSLSAASSAGDFSAPLTDCVELSLDQVLLQRHWHCPYQRGNKHWKDKAEIIKSSFWFWVMGAQFKEIWIFFFL